MENSYQSSLASLNDVAKSCKIQKEAWKTNTNMKKVAKLYELIEEAGQTLKNADKTTKS